MADEVLRRETQKAPHGPWYALFFSVKQLTTGSTKLTTLCSQTNKITYEYSTVVCSSGHMHLSRTPYQDILCTCVTEMFAVAQGRTHTGQQSLV